MITITEYAKQNKVSYEAVRKRINRLGDLITPHIFTENGVKVIDDEGVELLKQGAHKMPVVVYTEEVQSELNEARDTIQELQADKIKLLEDINEANKRLFAISEELNNLKVEQAKLESDNKNLLEDKERAKAENEKAKQDLQTITEAKAKTELELEQSQESNTRLQSEIETQAQEIQEQAEELASYHKTIFGLYRKDKREG